MFHPVSFTAISKLIILYSLEKEPARRASPWRMLEHPWMTEMSTKRVNMRRYLAQVWGWDDKDAQKA